MNDLQHLISGYKHTTTIQIRFKDVDKLGHVNNANHLTYFETARIAYFNDVFRQQINWQQISLILAKSEITYKHPIVLEDNLTCYSKINKIGTKSFEMEYLLVSNNATGNALCAFGKCTLVCYNYIAKQTINIPNEWLNSIKNYENLAS